MLKRSWACISAHCDWCYNTLNVNMNTWTDQPNRNLWHKNVTSHAFLSRFAGWISEKLFLACEDLVSKALCKIWVKIKVFVFVLYSFGELLIYLHQGFQKRTQQMWHLESPLLVMIEEYEHQNSNIRMQMSWFRIDSGTFADMKNIFLFPRPYHWSLKTFTLVCIKKGP